VSPHRAPLIASRAAVAAPHHLAALAGLSMLNRGGNAVDTMVATNAALGVVYPHMTGMGGDAFWLIYHAASRKVHVLNASGRAGENATRERYLKKGAKRIEVRGPMAALTVPGAVDGWVQVHKRFGHLPLQECLAPAIEYARNGYPVSPSQSRVTVQHRDLLRTYAETASIFLKPDGSPYAAGDVLRNPNLANTLTAVAEGGREAFYEGSIAKAIGEFLSRCGGTLTADDFARHVSDWVDPAEVTYRGRRALNLPPNSQGFAAQQILGILEHFPVKALAEDPPGYVDLLVRATQLAFEDRDRYLTDPAFEPIPLDRLLSKAYLGQRAEILRRGVKVPGPAHVGAGDTTFSCCVDGEGNAVGVIQSLYHEWGSAVVAGDTGLLLQNRGAFFSLDPHHVNRLEPGKRTFHTLCAGLLLNAEGKPELVYGTMGGEGQPQTQAALVTRVIDHGLDVQTAIEAPRWLYGRNWGEEYSGLRLEGRFGQVAVEALQARGHERVSLVGEWDELMGHAQAIRVLPDGLEAGFDPRGDGAALGF
jgi:gamma-glutamyltranspeptidase